MANHDKTPAYELALAHGIDYPQLAQACKVRPDYCSSVLSGNLRVSANFRRNMQNRFGRVTDEILALATERYESLEPSRRAKAERRLNTPRPIVEPVITRIDVDFATYQIDEWIARFGRPGGSHDIHGRANGTFATEPDYCELAAGDSPR